VRVRSGRYPDRAALALLTTGLLTSALLAACDSSASSDAASPSSRSASPSGSPGFSGTTSGTPGSSGTTSGPPQLPPQTLTLGVIGSPGEIDQYRTLAETYAPVARRVTVKVEGWPGDAAMLASFREGERVPDVFLADLRHLTYVTEHQLAQPVDQLLDDRGFDFGDEYPRSSLTAFSTDNRLQCLPYGVQPAVVFYNRRLVKLGRIKNDPPAPGQGWTIEQFAAAGRWAVAHHPGIAGIHLDADLPGIAPFVYSGGGALYDDATEPTSLALSSTPDLQALIKTVRALQEPGALLTPAQLERHTPQEWFRRGRLALLEGTRRMVPDLRTAADLDFDVMPMPSLGTSATVGSLTGMCLSQHPRDVSTAADFLVYANSPEALALVAYGGYLQPANQTVALSDAFQQPDRLPRHAGVFTFSVKSMVYPPLVASADQVERTVDPLLDEMLHGTPEEVPRYARQIDRASYRILGPRFGPSASPSVG
jgi:multiple sugar transport system substrate-binding protein